MPLSGLNTDMTCMKDREDKMKILQPCGVVAMIQEKEHYLEILQEINKYHSSGLNHTIRIVQMHTCVEAVFLEDTDCLT